MTVPSILEEISLLPDDKGISALIPLRFVAFGGGPVKSHVGDRLAAAGVKLLNHYGATEIGPMAPICEPAPEYDHHYFRVRKDMDLKLELVQSSKDEAQQFKMIARPFGWTELLEVQDRLVENPKNPGTEFCAMGRQDDMIVLGTGEKVVPCILESMLTENEQVKNALAFGEGQSELGVMVELAVPLSLEEQDRFMSSIWSIILKANDVMDQHARIFSKEGVFILPSGATIPQSDKGSLMRKEAYRLFEADIAKIYKNLESAVIDDQVKLDADRIEEGLKTMIQTQLNWRVPAIEWNFDDDLFELGMDSLQAVRLRRLLISAARSLSLVEPVSPDFVYHNPSVTQIATALKGNLATERDGIEDYVEQYSSLGPNVHKGAVVVLTGSTGSLGSHILAHLVSLPNIARVVCLVRPRPNEDPYERQLHVIETKGIKMSENAWSKVELIQSVFAAPFLGLKHDDYVRLCGQVTHILHSAWPMDFKWKLVSFKAQFQSLQNLLKLARDAHQGYPMIRPRLLFISSIATVGQYGIVHGQCLVPEEPMSDVRCTNPFGYGEAKLVCEKIVENVARTHSRELEAAIVRVGQIAGSTKNGFWNTDEHFPAIVKSSQQIAALPQLDGVRFHYLIAFNTVAGLTILQTLSWLPVDLAAHTICDILLTDHPVEPIYHLENPVRQSWHDCLSVLASELGMSKDDFLPFDEWLEKVCAVPDHAASEAPVKPLSEFFEEDFERMSSGMVILTTDNAKKVSSTFRNLRPVGGELIAAYISRWRDCGFLK